MVDVYKNISQEMGNHGFSYTVQDNTTVLKVSLKHLLLLKL